MEGGREVGKEMSEEGEMNKLNKERRNKMNDEQKKEREISRSLKLFFFFTRSEQDFFTYWNNSSIFSACHTRIYNFSHTRLYLMDCICLARNSQGILINEETFKKPHLPNPDTPMSRHFHLNQIIACTKTYCLLRVTCSLCK